MLKGILKKRINHILNYHIPFKPLDEDAPDYTKEENGSLIGIYSIKDLEVDSDDEKDKDTVDEFTIMYGFSGITLDDDNEANISDLETISEEKDDTYSADSVIQLYEGEGYEEVKK